MKNFRGGNPESFSWSYTPLKRLDSKVQAFWTTEGDKVEISHLISIRNFEIGKAKGSDFEFQLDCYIHNMGERCWLEVYVTDGRGFAVINPHRNLLLFHLNVIADQYQSETGNAFPFSDMQMFMNVRKPLRITPEDMERYQRSLEAQHGG